MGLFSQKAAEEPTAAAAGAVEQGSREPPQRRARQAFDRGDEFFQIELPHKKLTRADLLGQIEEAGWRLLHADWVVTGEIVGIYLFRRDDTRVKPAASSEPEPISAPEPEPISAAEPEPISAAEPEPISAAEPEPISAPSESAKAPEGKSTRVRCHVCKHVHSVSVAQTSFACPNCNAKLKRKARES